MNDQKIEQSNGLCFGHQQLLANSIQNFISCEKKNSDLLWPKIYKALKPSWHTNRVSITRVVVSQSQPTATASDQAGKQPKQCRRAAQRAWQLILPPKPSITFRNSLQRDCHMTCRGSNLDSNLKSAAWPTSCNGFSSSKTTALTVWSLNYF